MSGRPYRGFKARSADLGRKRRRSRRNEILNAIDDGCRRLLGRRVRRQWQEAAAASPVIARVRAHHRANVLAVVDLMGTRASFADGTVIFGRAELCAELGISISTWKAVRRTLRRAGLLFLVTSGRKYWHGTETRNDAAVYVVAAPMTVLRKIGIRRSRAFACRESRPPTVLAEVVNTTARAYDERPGQRRPPSGRAQPGGRPRAAPARAAARAAGAVAGAIRQWAGQIIGEGWVSWLTDVLEAAGWSGADVTEALAYAGPGGPAHPYLHGSMRHADAVLRHRLFRYWFDGAVPLPSPSQRKAAAAAELAADQAAEQAARAQREAAKLYADEAPHMREFARQAALGNPFAAEVLRRRRGQREPGSARPPPDLQKSRFVKSKIS